MHAIFYKIHTEKITPKTKEKAGFLIQEHDFHAAYKPSARRSMSPDVAPWRQNSTRMNIEASLCIFLDAFIPYTQAVRQSFDVADCSAHAMAFIAQPSDRPG
ncbi:hypothetical protein AB7B76_06280 [Klebsiella pneumoniae]